MTPDISARLTNVPQSKARGEFVLPALRIRNEGSESVTVSNRLNLVEGDVLVECTDPSGQRNELRGVITVDSLPRTVELSAGQFIESGLFLFYASDGFTFDTVGSYELRVGYHPDTSESAVFTDSVELRITEPTDSETQALAEQTMVDDVARAIALCGLETDPAVVAGLSTLGERFPDRPEGALARFVLAELSDSDTVDLTDVFDRWGPTTTARWITALLSSEGGDEPTKRAYLDTLDRSERMIRGEPVDDRQT